MFLITSWRSGQIPQVDGLLEQRLSAPTQHPTR